jgi:hypothetical protein
MWDLPPQFATLAKRLLSAIADIKKSIQDQTEAVTEATKAANAQQGVRPQVLAEVSLPQGLEIRKSAADAGDDKKYQRRTLWVSSLTLIALVGYAIVSFYQLREMRTATKAATRAANEAEQSNTDARNRFQQEERPYVWLTSDGLGAPGYPASPAGQVQWSYRYTNYGKSPAYNIRWRHYLSIDGGPFVESYHAPREGSVGPPLPPTQVVSAEIVSRPGFTPEQISHAEGTSGNGISIRIVMAYTDGSGGKYETGICLLRLNTGAISYCRQDNYIK